MVNRRKLGRSLSRRRQAVFFHAGKSDFGAFFERAFGAPVSLEEALAARKQLFDFEKLVEKENSSLPELADGWNRIAGIYRKLLSPKLIESEFLQIRQHGNFYKTDAVASIGSGPAVLEAFLAKNIVPNGKVTCVDISSEMNRMASGIKARAGVPNISLLTAPGHKTGIPSSSQDKVLISNTTLPGTVHWQPVLDEAMRIIKKNVTARLIVSFAAENPGIIKKVGDSIEKAGFVRGIVAKYASRKNNSAVVMFASIPVGALGKP